MSDTLTLYGVKVVWDGIPLGGEVRAYDEATREKKGDLHIIEQMALTVLNMRRPASSDAYTLEKLRALPFNGDTVTSIYTVIAAIQGAMKGEMMGRTESGTPTPPLSTGIDSGSMSPATAIPQ